jgi:hypothetical protein
MVNNLEVIIVMKFLRMLVRTTAKKLVGTGSSTHKDPVIAGIQRDFGL